MIAAPSPRIKTINPNAAGKLSFSSGSLGLSTGFDFSALTGATGVEKLRPQTRQRVAFSLNLVPQVGHTFVVEFSGLIYVLLT